MATQAPQAHGQGPPTFEPPLQLLSSLSEDIQVSIREYEYAKSPQEKAAALLKLQMTSTKLSRATTPLPARLMQLNFGPNVNVAVRIAIDMGLFEALPVSGEQASISELSSRIGSDEEFLLRIARVLVSFDILQEPEYGAYSHTPFSRFLVVPAVKASTMHLFDNMLAAQTHSAGGYYSTHGFKSPEDPMNSPFTYAHRCKDMSIFDILETMPEKMALFNSAMMITAMVGLNQIAGIYPFDKLQPNNEGIALVDVGGGKGHIVNEILKTYPQMEGTIVLEDMDVVLEGGTVVAGDVKLQPYNFFNEQQPIVGSNYFLKAIFHDWPDNSCLQIMANLAPAMRGNPHSRLLICDLVLPDRSPDASKVLRDMNMLCIGGKERSLAQWQGLLGRGGFKIIKIWGSEQGFNQIIEAALDE